MLIGIVSDSHGRSVTLRLALQLFDRLGVQYVVHCGDVGIAALDELAGRRCTLVWGNTDPADHSAAVYARTLGVQVPDDPPALLELAGKRLAVFHGHERGFERAHLDLRVDYILHGHTHQRRDDRMGGVRIINPGALHRARQRTVATLDLAGDALAFHALGAL